MLLEKGPAYQFDLSLIELALSFPIKERKVDEMYFLSYPENMDLCSWNVNFTTSKTIKSKIVKFFHPIRNLKIKALNLWMLKKQKNIAFL